MKYRISLFLSEIFFSIAFFGSTDSGDIKMTSMRNKEFLSLIEIFVFLAFLETTIQRYSFFLSESFFLNDFSDFLRLAIRKTFSPIHLYNRT